METIRNYLETMFSSLPNTPEVQKAKFELRQMMEDKYTELKNEGKSDNEAVGVVISEFGNLEELAEELGIKSYMRTDNPAVGRHVTLDEVKDYLQAKSKCAYMIALGVLLCIMSPTGSFITSITSVGAITELVLFLFIAVAVGLFVYSGIYISKWDFLSKQACNIDFDTTKYVHDKKEAYRTTYALLITIGVILCVISVLPVIFMDELSYKSQLFQQSRMFDNIGLIMMFTFIAIGVFLIVVAGVKQGGYTTLLQVNDRNTVGGNYVASQKKGRYTNPTVAAIMSVYWPTITCIYLCWSFLTFDWHISWIIWPVAAVIEMLIKNVWREY